MRLNYRWRLCLCLFLGLDMRYLSAERVMVLLTRGARMMQG